MSKFNEIWNKVTESLLGKDEFPVSHWWATHVTDRRSDVQREGTVVGHTLTESGEVEFYDIQWADGMLEEHIPRATLDLTEGKPHKHSKAKKEED